MFKKKKSYYDNAIEQANIGIAQLFKEENSKEFIKVYLTLIKRSLFYDNAIKFIKYRLPSFIKFSSIEKDMIEIDLEDTCIFGQPWKPDRLIDSLKISSTLKKSINKDYIILKNLKIGIVGSGGNHAITAGYLHNLKSVACKIVDDTELLKEYSTDGKYWYKNDKKVEKVTDERFAVIFTLTKEYLILS